MPASPHGMTVAGVSEKAESVAGTAHEANADISTLGVGVEGTGVVVGGNGNGTMNVGDDGANASVSSARRDGKCERRGRGKKDEKIKVGYHGGMDVYREGCLNLERIRHARMYEAEKKRMMEMEVVTQAYREGVEIVMMEYNHAKRLRLIRMLCENMEKRRSVEELRYGMMKDEGNGASRRHEMSLRGRETGEKGHHGEKSMLEEDGVMAELEKEREKERDKGGNRRSRKNDNRQKVQLHLTVEDSQALGDLRVAKGEKRHLEETQPNTVGERKSKRQRK